MSEIPAELVPNEPDFSDLDWEEYADLLAEIDSVPITEETGH